MIRIENKRTYRGFGIYVGRPTALGNPFSEQKFGRAECIRLFAEWFANELKKCGPTYEMFEFLVKEYRKTKSMTLICWCAPLACHAEVIKREIERRVK